MKNQFKTKWKERLKVKNDSIVKTLTKTRSQIFINNEFIYLDKVQGKKEQDEIRFSCKHFFLNIKKKRYGYLNEGFS